MTESLMGPQHPINMERLFLVANSLYDQAYYDHGPYDVCLRLYERIVKCNEKPLGEEHPTTLIGRNTLAVALYKIGRVNEATIVSEQVLSTRERTLAWEHVDTLTSMKDLAEMLHASDRTEEATRSVKETLKLHRRSQPTLLDAVLMRLAAVSLLISKDGKDCEDAEALCQQAFQVTAMKCLRRIPKRLELASTFACVLVGLDKYTEAHDRFEEAITGWSYLFGPESRMSLECTRHLKELEGSLGHN